MNRYEWIKCQAAGDASEKFVAGLLGAERVGAGSYDLVVDNGRRRMTVDVKRDDKAADTDNLAIETVSVVETNAPGWAVTARADFIVVHVHQPDDCSLYVMSSQTLRDSLPLIRVACKQKETQSIRDGRVWTTLFYAPSIMSLMQWGVIHRTWKAWRGELLSL